MGLERELKECDLQRDDRTWKMIKDVGEWAIEQRKSIK